MPERQEITVDYEPGTVEQVTQHDGSVISLRKLATDYDIHDRVGAMNYITEHHARGEVVTGLLYIDPAASDLHDLMSTVPVPLNSLDAPELCPGSRALEGFNAAHR
jgi:2-oxoglutarate ferredoxin oxidoreductase subunit beta